MFSKVRVTPPLATPQIYSSKRVSSPNFGVSSFPQALSWFRRIARTQSSTTINFTPEFSTFGRIAGVNPSVKVQWTGLTLGAPPSWSRIPLRQVSMFFARRPKRPTPPWFKILPQWTLLWSLSIFYHTTDWLLRNYVTDTSLKIYFFMISLYIKHVAYAQKQFRFFSWFLSSLSSLIRLIRHFVSNYYYFLLVNWFVFVSFVLLFSHLG